MQWLQHLAVLLLPVLLLPELLLAVLLLGGLLLGALLLLAELLLAGTERERIQLLLLLQWLPTCTQHTLS